MGLDFSQHDTDIQIDLCTVLAWYYADTNEFDDFKEGLLPALKAVPRFLGGKPLNEHEAFLLYDALGCFDGRTQELEALYQRAAQEWAAHHQENEN